MKTSKVIEEIQNCLDKADKLALAEVERFARKILKRNPKGFSCFCMGMGSACFFDSKGNPVEMDDPRCIELCDFIDEFDRCMMLTGNSLKLDSWNGPVFTNW